MLPVTDVSPMGCKICDGPSPLAGVVDFHKCCLEFHGRYLPVSGIPIYYRRCQNCGFLFTTAFDEWSHQAFAKNIYNTDYKVVDPDYDTARPESNARLFTKLFAKAKSGVRILDYGGGSGSFAELLRRLGHAAISYDPFTKDNVRPSGTFDIITCFEVLEHSITPRETVADIMSLLSPGGLIVCSTLLQPRKFEKNDLRWWYIGPRNGHVSIHSRASLTRLFDGFGFRLVVNDDDNIHIAYTSVPSFFIE